MAGTIIADYIRTDANRLSLNVGNTTVASINANGILNSSGGVILNANGTFASGVTLPTSSLSGTVATAQIADSAITRAKMGFTGVPLQIVQAVNTTSITTTSTSFVASSFAASITPTFSTSKILVMVFGGVHDQTTTSVYNYSTIYRNNSVNLSTSSNGMMQSHYMTVSTYSSNQSMMFLDSPATTSSTTYTFYVKVGGGTGYFNNNGVLTMTLMEIAG
jgi:hypothetical protein